MNYRIKKIFLLSFALIISSIFLTNLHSKPDHKNIDTGISVDKNIIVKRAYSLLKEQKKYFRGCSEFVSKILNIPWENAEALMGENPIFIGTMPDYDFEKLTPGDVVGWKTIDAVNGIAHVAIYIGDDNCNFIDVKGRGYNPRKIQGYGKQRVYKSSAY